VSSDPWAEMTKQWREAYEENAALARTSWLDGQKQLATALAGSGVTDPAASASALSELWRSWSTVGESLWKSPLDVAGNAGPGSGGLGALTDSVSMSLASGSAVAEALRSMTEGPRLADVGAPQRRLAQLMEQWMAVQTSARTYESVVAAAWTQANSRFAERLSRGNGTGKENLDSKAALKLWLDTANEVLLETHRSQKFLDAQRQLLRAGMDFLLEQREFVEGLIAPAGLPTRTEIDEIHHSVHELRRRVKALEKASAATSQGKPDSPEATPSNGEQQ
jgi:class III poly(R)-hydroxyalkanoic acid synthase PhaE subunit